MAYGLEQGPFVESGPMITVARPQPAHVSSAYRAWRKLSPDRRLAAVERTLTAHNLDDGYPLAL